MKRRFHKDLPTGSHPKAYRIPRCGDNFQLHNGNFTQIKPLFLSLVLTNYLYY